MAIVKARAEGHVVPAKEASLEEAVSRNSGIEGLRVADHVGGRGLAGGLAALADLR